MRQLYYMAVLCCLLTGLLFAFNMVVQLMYYRLYLS
jgi:hypothetical protein